MSRITVGIDLGTTYSEIYKMVEGHPEVIQSSTRQKMTPSRIAVDPKSDTKPLFVTGGRIMNIRNKTPENIIYEPKRIIGRRFDDEYVRRDIHYWPFKIVEGENNLPMYEVVGDSDKRFTVSAIDISAEILALLKSYTKVDQVDAVITVPSYFSVSQIEATKKAGIQAKLNVLRCLPEPIAASIAYGYSKRITNQTIVIYDLGGGTFDCCIVKIEDGKYRILTSDGHSHLGGADFDNAIVKFIAEEYRMKNNGEDLYERKKDMAKLKDIAERAKISLSSAETTLITFDTKNPLTMDDRHYEHLLTRQEFQGMIRSSIELSLEFITRSLEQLSMTPGNIDEVILVGGSTRIPFVTERLAAYFNREINSTLVNLDEAVAEGAAIYADALSRGIDMFPELGSNANLKPILEPNLCGDPIMMVPYNIYINPGNGYNRILTKGQYFRRNESMVTSSIRVNRYVNGNMNYMAISTINIFIEKDDIFEFIGSVDIDTDDPKRTKSQLVLGVCIIYDEYGKFRLIIRDSTSQKSEDTEIIIRGDMLDVYPEKTTNIEKYRAQCLCENLMESLISAGNSDIIRQKRKTILEILEWIQENGKYCEIEDLEEKMGILNSLI